ncbi:MAG: hypothetical protein HY293_13120, partial [Planctomycetes bacterium]|nr:hypothetical protein [Planctomycetota bacterium]
FAIRPAEDNLYVAATVWDKTKKGSKLIELGEQGAPLKAGEWRKFVLPVSLFTPPDPMVFAFVLQTTKTATQPLLFVDSVAFLKEGAGEKPPAELDAYRARWSKAAAKAARRDYAGAQKELEEGAAALKEDAAKAEAAADLELLKLASQVASEAAKAVERWTKGQKVKFDFLNAGGDPETAEGTLLSADALRLSVQRDGGAFELPASELSAASLAEIFRGRADRKPTDARAAAAFCAFEGDADAARKQLGDGPALPDKLLGISKERPAAEAAARRLFWTAEAEFLTPKRRFAAIEKFSSLVSGDATAFAARLRPYVAARLEAAKDTVFLADDLSAAGTFTMSGGAKIDACWTSTADSAAAKAKENYVEAEFHVFPGTAYRAWLWAAACCQETFDYSLQGSELSAPNSKNPKEPIACEPGGDAALPGRIPSITLRKYHAQHGGPKEPARWEWIPLTLPKYETSGPRKLRVLTNQQGFTVAAIVVSAVRRETPREAEMKDLEKARFGIRRSMNTGPLGFILHEYWLGIEGVTVDTLVKHPSYSGKPSGTGFRDSFEGPKDLADNYGSRMRGYVHPTVSGNYTFWIASDDGSELWVSGDDTPARKRLVCGQTMAAGFREWTKYSTQKSQPVPLTAGKRYYVECLHKEGGVGDHISVGWTLPDGSEERPIP